MFCTCSLTVSMLISSESAISWLESPIATNRSTWVSRGVSGTPATGSLSRRVIWPATRRSSPERVACSPAAAAVTAAIRSARAIVLSR